MSINVQVRKSVTQNPSHHGNNNVIAIDIRYNNYIEGVFNESLLFGLPIEDDITWDKIFGTENGEIQDEPDCWFAGHVEEYLAELDMGFDADMEVIEKIAEGYLELKETGVDVELGSSSCLRVFVEIGMNNVKGIRAFLETCGVSFSQASSSIAVERCAICLETMDKTEVARLRCNHVFHGDCVVEMVHQGRVNANANATATDSCPLCRTEFIAFST